MKILWVNPNFLHPTTKGGQIRTLEMLRRLHRRHEIHYVTFENPEQPEGAARAHEYSTHLHAIPHDVVSKRSPRFALELLKGLISEMPVAISRYYSPKMKATVAELIGRENFDVQVCDFLVSAPNFPELSRAVLFQHNVETMIWRRHTERAGDFLRRFYFNMQAERMLNFERKACREAAGVIAVSEQDAGAMRSMFEARCVSHVGTGVDLDYFARPGKTEITTDLVFVGSMDWLPNIDGVRWFVNDVLPLIRRRRPDCSVAVVGRAPDPSIKALVEGDAGIRLTGTVPDVRPYLWRSALSIVPLRIGGGTRLKIYESMAARTPVVSTAIGAEGLPVTDGVNIVLRDSAEAFAEACTLLLDDRAEQARMAEEAYGFVAESFSWDRIIVDFESQLSRSISR